MEYIFKFAYKNLFSHYCTFIFAVYTTHYKDGAFPEQEQSSSSTESLSLDDSLGDNKKRKKNDAWRKMIFDNVLLTATKNALEKRISELEHMHDEYTSEQYALSLEMKSLKTLCLEKLSNIESKNRSTKETEDIKAMVNSNIKISNLKLIKLETLKILRLE